MMSKLIHVTLFLLNAGISAAQYDSGARLTAMAQTGATAEGVWALTANPAGAAKAGRPALALSYSAMASLPEISKQTVAFLLPLKRNALGLAIRREGFSAFRTLNAGFTYGKQFGAELSIATRFNYHQVSAAGYGSVNGYSFDLGAIWVLNTRILLGAYVNNPLHQKYQSGIDFPLPSNFNIGISCQTSAIVTLTAEIKREPDQPAGIHLGLEYIPARAFQLRGGLSVNPFRHYAGMGVLYGRLELSVAVTSDPFLGYQPQISTGYVF
jgi:hypothetical protein